MTRPTPTRLLHFTHIDHLPSIVADGLLADGAVGSRLQVEVGSRSVKSQRRSALVPIGPGGCVADYVPFYFAPRSPMMFAIQGGQVPEYGTDLSSLVYLVTSVERLVDLALPILFTRRNAALRNAEFFDNPDELDALIDWPLMQQLIWRNTPQDPDRMARRMAECLVHQRVPWAAIGGVAARDDTRARAAEEIVASLSAPVRVRTRPDWYF